MRGNPETDTCGFGGFPENNPDPPEPSFPLAATRYFWVPQDGLTGVMSFSNQQLQDGIKGWIGNHYQLVFFSFFQLHAKYFSRPLPLWPPGMDFPK